MNKLPEWFNLNNYKDELTLEEWAYEIWVRSQYYRHASFFSSSGFVANPLAGFESISETYFGELILPFSAENYKIFLKNNRWFLNHFEDNKNKWITESKRQSIEFYGVADVLQNEEFNIYPDNIPKDDVKYILGRWFETAQPIGVNLEKTDDELMVAFKQYLRERRKELKEFASLGKSIVEQTCEWHEFKLLALFDLLCWREMVDSTITYAKIGAILWPDDEIELEQRVRKKGLPLIEKVFSFNVAKVLYLEHLKTVKKTGQFYTGKIYQ